MAKVLEKTERRLGEKLFIKGDRCAGPKCAAIRRGYAPGMHGKTKRRRSQSDFGKSLQEKQKVRITYGLDDRDLSRYVKKAEQTRGIFDVEFLKILERRLDNAVFRLGFAVSRRAARQAVTHGHILVNGRAVRSPSYQIKAGDKLEIKQQVRDSSHFADMATRLKKYTPPKWMKSGSEPGLGEIVGVPDQSDSTLTTDLTKIKEFYSR